jgi:fatty-acyl-CoA synthase
VRLQPAIETTGTFKYRKIDLVTEGFDPANTKDPLYFRDPAKGYVKLTKAVCHRLIIELDPLAARACTPAP